VNIGDMTRYRLLDTTRAYAAGKLAESGGADAIKRRHAVYYRELLEQTKVSSTAGAGVKLLAAHGEHLGNVRAGLEWSFFEHGDMGGRGCAGRRCGAPLY
jgi:predicted ATPase